MPCRPPCPRSGPARIRVRAAHPFHAPSCSPPAATSSALCASKPEQSLLVEAYGEFVKVKGQAKDGSAMQILLLALV
eukprot:4608134-Pleurochrysis_carterae.AAC.4